MPHDGNFKLAEGSYSRAIKLSEKMKDKVTTADAAVGLGLSLRALGRWKEAINLFSKAKDFYMRSKDEHGMAFVFWAEGGAYRVMETYRRD